MAADPEHVEIVEADRNVLEWLTGADRVGGLIARSVGLHFSPDPSSTTPPVLRLSAVASGVGFGLFAVSVAAKPHWQENLCANSMLVLGC